MATVSNPFDVLGSGAAPLDGEGKKRNRRRGKAKNQDSQASGGQPGNQHQAAVASERESAPSVVELEAAGNRASGREERLALWNSWASRSARGARFADTDGQMVTFREVLLASRGLEASIGACVDAGLDDALEGGLASMLDAVLAATNSEAIRSMATAVARLGSSLASASPEVVLAAKGAVSDVIAALKKADAAMSQRPGKKGWSGSGKGGQDEHGRNGGRPVANRQGSELKDAAEAVRREQDALDAFRDEVALAGGGTGELRDAAHRAIEDFKAMVVMSGQAAPKANGKKQKGRNRAQGGGAQASQLLEPLQREQEALEGKAGKLMAEIASLEARLAALRAQLNAVNETKSHLVHRKSAITGSMQSSSAAPQSAASQEEQMDAARWLETVLSRVQGRLSRDSSGQQESTVAGYLEACHKLLQLCITKQDDFMKSVKFLRECIERNYTTEKNLMAMEPNVGNALLGDNRSKREGLEHQLQGALKEAGMVAGYAEKALDGMRSRADVLACLNPTSKDVEGLAARVLRRHMDIQTEAEGSKPQLPAPSPPPPTKKKFDASAIIKQAEGEFAQSQQHNGQRSRLNQKFPQQQQQTVSAGSPQPSTAPNAPTPSKHAAGAAQSQPRQLKDTRVPAGVPRHQVDASIPVSHVPQTLVDPELVQPSAHMYHAIAPLQQQPAQAVAHPQITSLDAVTAEPRKQDPAVASQALGFNPAITAPQPNELLEDAYQSHVGQGLSDGLHQPDCGMPMPASDLSSQGQYIAQVNAIGMDVSGDPSRGLASSSYRRGWRQINPVSPVDIGGSTSPTPAEARDKGLIGREKLAKKEAA